MDQNETELIHLLFKEENIELFSMIFFIN